MTFRMCGCCGSCAKTTSEASADASRISTALGTTLSRSMSTRAAGGREGAPTTMLPGRLGELRLEVSRQLRDRRKIEQLGQVHEPRILAVDLFVNLDQRERARANLEQVV